MAGGPTLKLTPAVHASIVESISYGAPIAVACRAVGVSDDSYRRWIKQGQDETETDPRFASFAADIARAEADRQVKSVRVLTDETDWRAHAEFLKRRHPEDWSEKRIEEHVGPGGGPQQLEVVGVALTDVLAFAQQAGAIPANSELPSAPPDPA